MVSSFDRTSMQMNGGPREYLLVWFGARDDA